MPLCAVIVLYQRPLADTESFRTLDRALAHGAISPDDFELIVWDNSPTPQSPPTWRHNIRYHHDPANGGLVPGYNSAAEQCGATGVEWLLLLDQDTGLPDDYFVSFADARQWVESRTVAIVPKVRVGSRTVSPVRVILDVAGLGVLNPDFQGLRKRETATINSGSFVRVSFLRELGGYPADYRLDAVDLWFFAATYAHGRNIYVMPTWIEQELSITNIPAIAIARWRSILSAETQYYLDMRGRLGQMLMSMIASSRAAKVLLTHRSPAHAAVGFSEAARLFFKSITA